MPRAIPLSITARAAPAPTRSYRPAPAPIATPPELTAGRVYQQQLVERAQAATETALPSPYLWGQLNSGTIISNRAFPAGTRVVVQPSTTATVSSGKSGAPHKIVRVWVKFGQTFDASSWLSGWVGPHLVTVSSQQATWSNQVGFGSLKPQGLGQASAVVGLAVTVGILALGVVGGLYLYDRLKKRR